MYTLGMDVHGRDGSGWMYTLGMDVHGRDGAQSGARLAVGGWRLHFITIFILIMQAARHFFYCTITIHFSIRSWR